MASSATRSSFGAFGFADFFDMLLPPTYPLVIRWFLQGNSLYKLEDAVRAKGRKPYANRKTAVFISGTDILHADFSKEVPVTKEDIEDRLEQAISSQPLGSALVFSYIFEVSGERRKLSHLYIRKDHPECDDALRDFLDAYYPKGDWGTSGKVVGLPGWG